MAKRAKLRRNDASDAASDVAYENAGVGAPIGKHGGKYAATELIEPGRGPALASFAAPPVGAGERLVRLAYRLGVPGPALVAPFSKPQRLRLMATVASPLPGSKSAGTALRAGHFQVHGLKLLIGQFDFAGTALLSPPVERMVHGFGWLADLEACAPREQVVPVAERIVSGWLAANAQPPARPGLTRSTGAAWSVANTGHRLLNWLVHAPLILSGPDQALRVRVLAAMSDTARWLDRNAARGADGLARVAGWTAIVAAGLLLPDGRPRRLYGEAGLIAALGELLGDDGGVLSRSPIDQIEAIALLVQLSACYRATRRALPPPFQSVLAMLVPPLLTLGHEAGGLASWQGGWAVPADDVAALVEASGVRTRPLREVRQWGYQRLVAGHSIALLDAAPPPLARHARTGCASTLAIEFSHAGQRLFVNCGGAAAAGGAMPVRLEQGLRATAAHSALVLDDTNSTAVLINGRLGTGVSEVEVDRRMLDSSEAGLERDRVGGARHGATRLEASHDGYVSRYGLTHRRVLILRDDGNELRGEDLLVPARGRAPRGKVACALRFHLGPGIDVAISDRVQGGAGRDSEGPGVGGQSAGLALPDGSYWQFRVDEGEIAVEESIWADGQGRPVPIQQLVIQGLVSRGGGAFSWVLRKLAPSH